MEEGGVEVGEGGVEVGGGGEGGIREEEELLRKRWPELVSPRCGVEGRSRGDTVPRCTCGMRSYGGPRNFLETKGKD